MENRECAKEVHFEIPTEVILAPRGLPGPDFQPRRAREPSWMHFGALLEPFGSSFGIHLEFIWGTFWRLRSRWMLGRVLDTIRGRFG